MSGGAGGKRAVVAAATLLAVVAALLWHPLLSMRTHTLGPFQLLAETSALTAQPGPAKPTNLLLSDPAVEMHPWAVFAAEELREGRLALWNPHNAGGKPLLANYQSALLSPFTLPYYVLPLKAAVLASALLKLLVTGTFAYLFLCSLRCTPGAALLGGTALAASGTCMVLLQHPHAGVFALLPACLYCAEVFFARSEAPARSGPTPAGAAAWLALALGLSALAGHPETLLYSYVVVAGFSLHRLTTLAAGQRLRAAGLLLAAALAGLTLGAVQILPFVEYLGQSDLLSSNRAGHVAMLRHHWPLHVFPHLSGAPARPDFAVALVDMHYQDIAAFFVGGVVLLCALIGVLRTRADANARFFTVLAMLWVVYAYDVFGVCTWLGTHTPLSKVPVTRSHPLWTPSACFLAALGVSAVERGTPSSWRRGLATAALAGGLLALFHWAAQGYLGDLAQRLEVTRSELPEYAERHRSTMEALFALGAAGLVAVAASRRTWSRAVGYAALIAAVVGSSLASVAGHVPTVPDRYVYPRTEPVEALRTAIGGERALVLSTGSLPAELNMVYDIWTVEGFDALDIGDIQRLTDHFFLGEATGAACRASKRGLELFGVGYVATRGDWVPIDTDLGDFLVMPDRRSAYIAYEWLTESLAPWPQALREETLRFELEASRDGLDGVAVQFVENEGAMASAIACRLIDVDRDRELVVRERRLGALPVLPRLVPGVGRCELALRFEPVPDSKGRKLALEITTPDAKPGTRPRVVRMPWQGDAAEPQLPMIDLGYGQNEFELVCPVGNQKLYRYTGSPGRAWIVGSALAAATHEEAFELVTAPAFEPLEQVVLERAGGETHAGPFELEIRSAEPGRWQFEVDCATPGWLVVAQAFYPGWKARLDSEECELLLANYGLTGVELPAGRHQVVLEYDPVSFRIGGGCALVAAGLVGLGLVHGRRRRPG